MGNRLFQMAYLYAQMKEGKIPDIYVQDFTLWEKYQDEIKKWFSEGIGIMPYTAIHLRVGGNPKNPNEPRYMENPYYVNLCNTGYYLKALEHFPQGKFLVFSDDMDYARAYFEGERFGFDDSQSDLESFNKMASCDGIITTNSSFSWWAGFLCSHVDRKIVAPSEKSWFADGIPRVKIPKDWIQIDP